MDELMKELEALSYRFEAEGSRDAALIAAALAVICGAKADRSLEDLSRILTKHCVDRLERICAGEN